MRREMMALYGVLAAVLLAALPVTYAWANPPGADEVKDQPGMEPTVTRGMPDLVRYWNFDPPRSPLFDIGKVTISGDARIRPEYRNNSNFGLANTSSLGRATGAASNGVSDQFIQQWARLGLNYAVSPDVDTFSRCNMRRTGVQILLRARQTIPTRSPASASGRPTS